MIHCSCFWLIIFFALLAVHDDVGYPPMVLATFFDGFFGQAVTFASDWCAHAGS